MTASFELSKADFTAFNLYHHRHSPTTRAQFRRSWFVPVAVWIAICTLLWYLADRTRGAPGKTFVALLPLFSGALIYFIYFPFAYRRKLQKVVEGMAAEGQNLGLFGLHHVTISPEGITDANEHQQSSLTWRGVERIVVAGEHAFIYANAVSAIIIPKRAFQTTAEFDAFVASMIDYQKKPQGPSS